MRYKILLTLVFGFLLVSLGLSQVRFGAKAGVSKTNITDAHSSSKSRYGVQAGVVAVIPISNDNQWFFQPEINYSFQGESNNVTSPDGEIEKQKIFSDFINFPLNLKIYFTGNENSFFAEAGPYFGFKINENIEKKNFITEADSYEYSKFDLGAGLGLGYSFDRKYELSVRGFLGFIDQIKNDADNKHNANVNFNLTFTYLFN